jgi:hypothetical protein
VKFFYLVPMIVILIFFMFHSLAISMVICYSAT